MGDFNIHINNSEDQDAQTLQDTLNAFNPKQHINIPTHNLGHTIDLIITSNDYMGPFIPGSYISDHRMITLNTNIPKPKAEIKSVHNHTDNRVQQFIDEFNNTPILNTSNLIDATNQFNSEILRTMDKIAPQRFKKITSRIKKPWYDNRSKTPKANSEKQGKNVAEIQGTITLEGIQKGKKQVHHNDKIQMKKRSLT